MSFTDLHLHAQLLKAIQQTGFDTPTPIQQQAIPLVLKGKDVIGCAQTGTGKTAAFTLPIIHNLLSNTRTNHAKTPRALILSPTRELAEQILKNLHQFCNAKQLRVGAIVGGLPYGPQIKMLHNTLDIVVATPGRLIDHLESGHIKLNTIETFVLDEADRMLDMGFTKPVEKILKAIPQQRQILMFTATLDKKVESLAHTYMNKPEIIRLTTSQQNHDAITQSLCFTRDPSAKLKRLEEELKREDMWQAVVFMKTKYSTEKLAKRINDWGIAAAALHGDMRQNARKRVVKQMHEDKLRVLVATDVAARGIDVKSITHVINFDLPQVAEDYIHRIGRTGRAGATGKAVSFVSNDERHLLRDIERLMGTKISAENADMRHARDESAPAKPCVSKKRTFGNKKPSSFNKGRPKSEGRSHSNSKSQDQRAEFTKQGSAKKRSAGSGNNNFAGKRPTRRFNQRSNAQLA